MRVCLTNPPWRDQKTTGIRAGCRVPTSIAKVEHTFVPFPFTLAYATAVLERNGIPVLLIDAIAEELDEPDYLSRVKDFQPDLIVNEVATQSHSVDLSIASKLKTHTGARIALCGPHASAIPEELLLQEFVDFVFLGEYEMALLETVTALEAGKPVTDICGLAYRSDLGEPVIGKKRQVLVELDALPYPHRATLPMHRYRVAGYAPPVLYMYASRGCPFRCNFCVWPQWFKQGSYRVRTPKAVAEEIQVAQVDYGPFHSIYFDDDTFNVGRSRMLEMARALREMPNRIPWGCNMRPDLVDHDTMEELVESGLFNIRIGVESGDPAVLNRIQKNLDLDSVKRCISIAHELNVKVHVTFTIGLSGESWDSVKQTARFARSLAADSMAFTITTPYPGTAYYDEVVENGLLTDHDWNNFSNRGNPVVATEHLSPEEILRAERYVMRSVYYSPRFILRRLKYINGPAELLAVARKSLTFLQGRY